MYDAIPKDLQSKVNFSSRLNYKEFYEEIKDKHSITVFNKERKFYNKPNSQHYYNNNIKINNQEDPMDIDNFENYKKKSKEFSKKHDRPKHCVICDNNSHLAKDCYFNPVGTNRNNKRAKNSRNNKRRSNPNFRNKHRGNNLNISDLSHDHNNTRDTDFNEIFGDYMDNIQYDSDNDDDINLCEDNINIDQSNISVKPQLKTTLGVTSTTNRIK
ncbi:hypothetical protein PIROE2DRAFT_1567 [Piromyces sp. E2]|nr:hypothetical protein PIROE2DRAFT_1567 [Piromyces sp. E2]|eukprot:OUM70403.1 hypothetical protein PIROE2DRAFT_1567 [Piromyces sp. E2]